MRWVISIQNHRQHPSAAPLADGTQSSDEPKWQSDLDRFDIKARLPNKLMSMIEDRCLTTLSGIYKIRAVALHYGTTLNYSISLGIPRFTCPGAS